jgi:hypothetical protein
MEISYPPTENYIISILTAVTSVIGRRKFAEGKFQCSTPLRPYLLENALGGNEPSVLQMEADFAANKVNIAGAAHTPLIIDVSAVFFNN